MFDKAFCFFDKYLSVSRYYANIMKEYIKKN